MPRELLGPCVSSPCRVSIVLVASLRLRSNDYYYYHIISIWSRLSSHVAPGRLEVCDGQEPHCLLREVMGFNCSAVRARDERKRRGPPSESRLFNISRSVLNPPTIHCRQRLRFGVVVPIWHLSIHLLLKVFDSNKFQARQTRQFTLDGSDLILLYLPWIFFNRSSVPLGDSNCPPVRISRSEIKRSPQTKDT
jgi:hypothetical protein